MQLIADSGSTKTDWAIVQKDCEPITFQSAGINPVFHSTQEIITLLLGTDWVKTYGSKITHLQFYGAGCMSDMHCNIVEKALRKVFSGVTSLRIQDDLTGAVKACCGLTPGIVGVLGTGANACYFDGETIHQHTPSLGYILGDEGSGAYFGKMLLKKILYKELPLVIIDDFRISYGLNKAEIIQSVYHNDHPNVFLASFMPFYAKHQQVLEIKFMLKKGFREYLTHHILSYEQAAELPVHFVGSIAKIFHSELLETSSSMNISIGKTLASPIDALVNSLTEQ